MLCKGIFINKLSNVENNFFKESLPKFKNREKRKNVLKQVLIK